MSKFPSLEEIDQDLVTDDSKVENSTNDNGEESDFLSREKAALGDDAQEFDQGTTAADAEVSGFEASFPPLENEAPAESSLGPNGLISEPAEPYMPGQPADTPVNEVKKLSLEDSEPIKEWKARQELEIQERDKLSDQKREETRENAKKGIDDFYENYNTKKDKSIEQTRDEEKKFIEERDGGAGVGSTWERIVKLIDTSDNGAKSKFSDKSRFKELLMSLKSDSNAPGAGGY